MDDRNVGEFWKIGRDFKDLNIRGKREVLKTAQSLLKIQKGNRTILANFAPEGASYETPKRGHHPFWMRGLASQ